MTVTGGCIKLSEPFVLVQSYSHGENVATWGHKGHAWVRKYIDNLPLKQHLCTFMDLLKASKHWLLSCRENQWQNLKSKRLL